jgi:hypothetical protein
MKTVPQEPGPGRSTSAAAFGELTKEIALQNERAHKEALKRRAVRDQEAKLRRREQDRL